MLYDGVLENIKKEEKITYKKRKEYPINSKLLELLSVGYSLEDRESVLETKYLISRVYSRVLKGSGVVIYVDILNGIIEVDYNEEKEVDEKVKLVNGVI